MEVKAIAKSVRISPRKLRLVVDAIRSMKIEDAYRMLEVTHKRAALIVSKTLKSAVANAIVNNNLDAKTLYIASVMVNEAQALKRFRPSTRGRVHHYKKRGSHLTIILKQNIVKTQVVAMEKTEKIEEKKEEKGGEK